MKAIRQPLSEDFVYGSPERIPGNSFRWIPARKVRRETPPAQRKGAAHDGKPTF
ncbi:MAG: hypothetical protein ABW101_03890 [Candidatus Thiodiazotropha sp.]